MNGPFRSAPLQMQPMMNTQRCVLLDGYPKWLKAKNMPADCQMVPVRAIEADCLAEAERERLL